ncbi:hypothetical protein P3T39_005063 [Kitasatospora sp. GP82]|nr:hypothetical protein [Kitasatospora sp. GP82]
MSGGLPAELRLLVRHVVTENARVRQAVALLDAGAPAGLGPVLTAGHASLRDDFRVPSPRGGAPGRSKLPKSPACQSSWALVSSSAGQAPLSSDVRKYFILREFIKTPHRIVLTIDSLC